MTTGWRLAAVPRRLVEVPLVTEGFCPDWGEMFRRGKDASSERQPRAAPVV
jgi:hypothetical protein